MSDAVVPSIFDKKSDLNISTEFEYKPLKKGLFARIEESAFRKLTKQPVAQKKAEFVGTADNPRINATKETIMRSLPIERKSLAEKVRDQIKFPAINKSGVVVNGCALVAFVVGSYIIYCELPTHAEIALGIVIVSVASSIIVSNR